ncbi:hypothetical protein BCR42DRAFT_359799 [Absidia repens]|uniref:GRAM domain-containing protein n=1 Tax=Absidia repens TaxID=90262 RepID=A0A1X2I3F4_9FUNG|nr:hypothetical protein BCR42DRAFT_359799 [Absidia repens]
MPINVPDTPIPVHTLQQHNRPFISNDSAVSVSTTGTVTAIVTTDDQDEHEGEIALRKTISSSSYSTLSSPASLSLPENCTFASAKDNNYFHSLFKSVPEHDRLLEIYKCALHRDILLQGHLYLSENYACFHANIFGWITNLVIEYSGIVLIERKMTAMIIPNGIQIHTQNAKHTFASFIFREAAYQQLISLWTIHQSQQQQQSQSSSTLVDESTTDSDGSDSDDKSIAIDLSDEDAITSLNVSGQKPDLDNIHHNRPLSSSDYSIWKIMLMVLLLLNSLWMIHKWAQLDRRIQHHHHKYRHQHALPFDSSGLSSSSCVEKSHHHHHHHAIYTKLNQLRRQMETLNQQIIDQQLHIYELSPLDDEVR